MRARTKIMRKEKHVHKSIIVKDKTSIELAIKGEQKIGREQRGRSDSKQK